MADNKKRGNSVHSSVDRMVRSDHIADTYEDTYADHGLWTYDNRLLLKWFGKPGRLLDLGCGTGRTLIEFGKRGFDVTGVDLAPPMLKRAREKLDAAGLPNVKLIEGNIADLPFDRLDPPYDYAVCMFATLGFVRGHANRVRALEQARDLLRPGGQYVFHVQSLLYNLPTLHFPFIMTGLAKWLIGRGEVGDQMFWWYEGIWWMYMHAFRPKEIERLVADAGLELVELAYLNKDCTGPMEGDRLRAWRSHGYIVRCRRPDG